MFPFLSLRLDSSLFGTSTSCTSNEDEACYDLELADFWFYTGEAVWPLHIVAYAVIFMSEPTRARAFGPAQVLSMILGVSSKALFVFRDPTGAIYHIGGPLFATAWIAIGASQRCRRVKTEFSVEQVRNFVHKTLPAGALGVLPSIIFLLGESMACITDKLGGDDDGSEMCAGADIDTFCKVGCNTADDMYVRLRLIAAVALPHRLLRSLPSLAQVQMRGLGGEQQRPRVHILVGDDRPCVHLAVHQADVHHEARGPLRP